MGTTLVTLNIMGAEPGEIKPYLASTDRIRTGNPPWLTVLPAHDDEGLQVNRLEKIAMRLTQSAGTAALLFFYFDDEAFYCHFYQGGKRTASGTSGGSWAKLGKELGALLGDSEIPKALRYASKCSDIEEQIDLLEETIGTVLYDSQETKPRSAARSSKTLHLIQARERMLGNRPNRFCLRELEQTYWPVDVRFRQTLLRLLQPQWMKYHLSALLSGLCEEGIMVPGAENMAAYPYTDFDARKRSLLLYHGDTGECFDYDASPDEAHKVLWQTKCKAYVILFYQTISDRRGVGYWSHSAGMGYVRCVDDAGKVLWQFTPVLKEHQTLKHVSTSPDGIITLMAPGFNAIVKADTAIWQIDAETGAMIRERRFCYTEEIQQIIYNRYLNAFVFCKRSTGELLIADENLEIIRRIDDYHYTYYIRDHRFVGHYLWNDMDLKGIQMIDLIEGTAKTIRLEVKANPMVVLPDGRILCVNEKQNRLFVFDSKGTVISRLSVPGMIVRIIPNDTSALIVEQRTPKKYENGVSCLELFEETSIHVWSVDPIAE